MRLLQNLQVCVEHLIYNNNFSCILPNSNSNTGGAGGKLISNNKADNIFRKPIDLWGFEGAAAVKPGNPSSLSPLCIFPVKYPHTHKHTLSKQCVKPFVAWRWPTGTSTALKAPKTSTN